MVRIKVTKEAHATALAAVNWDKIDALTDKDIDQQVAAGPQAKALAGGDKPGIVVRRIRQLLGLSQSEFAARYGIPVGTLRDWEQNRKKPDATALAFLKVIAKEPDMVAKVLGTG